jgi:predicted MFS family arabinose efflux permease
VSAYTFAAGLSGLLAAFFVDRFERKRLLLLLYVLFGLTTLACALAPTYGMLMLARIAAGVFGGILSAMTQTIIGDVIPFERRGRATGLVMMSFSLATVVGVPGGLFLANWGGWHSSFIAIAVACTVVGALAVWSLPRLDKHVANARGQNMTFAIRGVWADNNHRLALAMSFAMMYAAFTVIPYITIYMQANHILLPTEIPFIYLAGGIVTLLSARWIGTLTDRIGKRKMFQRMLLLSMVPMTLTTVMQPYALPVVLLVSASLFFFMNARMIPGMAFLTSAAQPQFRGAFMSLNGAVQSLSIGLATWIGGVLIQRNPQGQVTHYWMCAVAGIAASVVAYWLAQHVKMHTIEPQAPAA